MTIGEGMTERHIIMNIRVVRKKIKSIKNVKKITKAMQMVSAVKMRKAQQLEHESRPYREALTQLIAHIAKKLDSENVDLLQVDTTNARKDLVILVTANKGLAGAFNVNIFRYVFKHNISFENTDFIVVGTKGEQFLGRIRNTNMLACYSNNSVIAEASAIFDHVLREYKTGNYRKVSIVYNKFISTLKSEVEQEVLLPFDQIEIMGKKEENKTHEEREYMIEPSPAEILEQLILSFIENKIRGALISSEAVEHSARMMAMKSATDNASELIYNLTLLSNKLRQEKITNELLDMITAKESVDIT